MMPGAHFKESFGESMNPDVYERIDMVADHYHFDTRGNWTESRDGKANDLGGGHAHIGMMIYQGKAWPEAYRGKLFTLNMHGRRANVERLERQALVTWRVMNRISLSPKIRSFAVWKSALDLMIKSMFRLERHG